VNGLALLAIWAPRAKDTSTRYSIGGFSWFGKGGARVREVEWSPSRASGGQRGFRLSI